MQLLFVLHLCIFAAAASLGDRMRFKPLLSCPVFSFCVLCWVCYAHDTLISVDPA